MNKGAIWFGPIIAIAACVSYLFFFSQFPITRDNPVLCLALAGFGLLLSLIGLTAWRKVGFFRRFVSFFGLLISALSAVFLFAYVFIWSSDIPVAPKLPSFASVKTMPLKATGGKTLSLADYQNKQVVVSFFRGYW